MVLLDLYSKSPSNSICKLPNILLSPYMHRCYSLPQKEEMFRTMAVSTVVVQARSYRILQIVNHAATGFVNGLRVGKSMDKHILANYFFLAEDLKIKICIAFLIVGPKLSVYTLTNKGSLMNYQDKIFFWS